MKTRKDNSVLAWKFTLLNGKGLFGNLDYQPGYIYTTTEKDLALCRRGIHASLNPLDAYSNVRSSRIMRVRMWEEILSRPGKLVARNCEVLWAKDISNELKSFSFWCARRAVDHVKNPRVKKLLLKVLDKDFSSVTDAENEIRSLPNDELITYNYPIWLIRAVINQYKHGNKDFLSTMLPSKAVIAMSKNNYKGHCLGYNKYFNEELKAQRKKFLSMCEKIDKEESSKL